MENEEKLIGECWHFGGTRNIEGYGQLTAFGGVMTMHRLAWIIRFGPIPPKMCVLHRCDTPSCFNPDHLWLGTHTDNMRDMVAKGRHSNGRKTQDPEERARKMLEAPVRKRLLDYIELSESHTGRGSIQMNKISSLSGVSVFMLQSVAMGRRALSEKAAISVTETIKQLTKERI